MTSHHFSCRYLKAGVEDIYFMFICCWLQRKPIFAYFGRILWIREFGSHIAVQVNYFLTSPGEHIFKPVEVIFSLNQSRAEALTVSLFICQEVGFTQL